jgi:hypothetical protein
VAQNDWRFAIRTQTPSGQRHAEKCIAFYQMPCCDESGGKIRLGAARTQQLIFSKLLLAPGMFNPGVFNF